MAHSSARWIRRACLLLSLCIALVALPELALIAARPESPGNLAAGARLRSSHTAGLLPWLVRGPVASEGSSWETQRVVVLGRDDGRIALDFGEPVEIGAFLVQADYDDEYQVFASKDAEHWSPIWRVPAAAGSGLRTRRGELQGPVRARYLELRIAGESSAKASTESVISAIRVYASPPDDSLALADESASAFPWLDERGVATAKVALASLGALLVVLVFVLDRRGASDRRRRLAKRLLLVVAAASVLGWWNFFQLTEQKYGRVHRNYWDVYHYYLGSKYARELGYTNLYRCHLAAELESGLGDLQLRRSFTRDLSSNELKKTPRMLGEAAACRDRFSAKRWQAFVHDHSWFRSKLPPSLWLQLPMDHGYNVSPAFAIAGSALANLAPMSDLAFVLWISLDTLLLVSMAWLVWTSFGWRAGCAAGIFLATNLVAGNHFTSGAFLRQDWLFLTVAGICCLKREQPVLAGALLVFATSLRIFPGFALLGVALQALVEMRARRSWRPSEPHRRLALAVVVSGVALLALSSAVAGRASVWSEFVVNTAKHHGTPQVQNVGVRALLHHVDQPDIRERPYIGVVEIQQSYERPGRRQLAIALAALFLPLLVVAVAREPDWVAAILGLTWLPFVTDVNNYYWSLLLVFALLTVRRPAVAYGFSAITVLFAALGLVYGYRGLAMFTWSSLALLLFFVWLALLFAAPTWREWLRGRRERRAGAYSM